MNPVHFKEENTVFAKDQPEYLPLPAFRAKDGNEVISCWQLSFVERIRILFFGKLWIRVYTFGSKLQPILPQIEFPFQKIK